MGTDCLNGLHRCLLSRTFATINALHYHLPGRCGLKLKIEDGLDPDHVGECVREGIECDWPYSFTDLEFEPDIEAQFAAIRQEFDKIRKRTPPR